MRFKSALVALICALLMSGCAGTVIDTATDAAIAVAKVPFKVGGAVVDVSTEATSKVILGRFICSLK